MEKLISVRVFEAGEYVEKEFSADQIVDAGRNHVNEVLGQGFNVRATSRVYDDALVAKYGREALKSVATNFGAAGYGQKLVLKNA